MNIAQALEQLDRENDAHWTQDGAPRIDIVSTLVGSQVSRQQIVDAAPEFSRIPIVNPEGDDAVSNEAADGDDEQPVDDHYADLCDAVDRQKKTLQDAHDKQAAAAANLAEQNRLLAELHDACEKLRPRNTNQQNIIEAITRSNQLRAEKGDRMKQLAASGLTPADIKRLTTVKAPIDQAMTRKTQRGTQRPNRGVK